MKYIFIATFLLFSQFTIAQNTNKTNNKNSTTEQNEYEIPITITPYKNTWIYLGSYFGKGKSISDSAWLNENSKGVFKGKNKLTGGIYFIVSPAKNFIEFELLMDEKQHFSITADTAHRDNPKIIGSLDNDLFFNYSKVSAEKGKNIQSLKSKYVSAKTKEDSVKYRDEILKIENALQEYRNKLIKENPNSLLATLFHVMKKPESPAIPIVNGKPDSLYPYRYMKEHYWDDVNFFDDRILRTPFFEPKLDEYFKYYISPEADSIIPEVKYILLSARTGKEMFPYLLIKFTNKYVKPEYMGQDKVFLYLFNEFYTKGDTIYLDAASRKMIFDRAYSLMANQIGEPAPPLNLTDTLGKVQSLYSLNAKYTIVVFWDPHCGHCKDQIPRIDSIYEAKWKNMGLKVYSVYIYNDNLPDWKKFINEKKLYDWIHVYQTEDAKQYEAKNGIAGFRQLYDARVTPTVYLLDEKKRIIAKQLTIEQFDDVLKAKSKQLAK